MPQCLKCGAELQVNEQGMAPVLCDRCAGVATRRARVGMSTGTFREFPATTVLLAINIAVFLGMVLTGGSMMGFSPHQSVLWGANYGPLTLSGDYWRLVTAGFIHAGLIHLALNMYGLWWLGQLAERLFGSWITFAVYVLTGVAGALLSVGLDPGRLEVGASGAIFGIAGAVLSGLKFGNVSKASWQNRQIFTSLLFITGFNLIIGFRIPGIDNMCHLGGLVSGLIFGVPLATASASGKKSFEWATIILAALILAGVGAQVVESKGLVPVRAAQEKLNSGDYAGAISILEPAVRSHPGNAQLHALLGLAYEQAGQTEKAIAAYQRALQLEPDFMEVKARLAQLQNKSPSDK